MAITAAGDNHERYRVFVIEKLETNEAKNIDCQNQTGSINICNCVMLWGNDDS